jgi:hypothetical protein
MQGSQQRRLRRSSEGRWRNQQSMVSESQVRNGFQGKEKLMRSNAVKRSNKILLSK